MTRDLTVFANAAVNAGTQITLDPPRASDDETVSILFGHERITLAFYDVESLERLRDLAQDGARQLRAVIEANAPSDTEDDELVGIEVRSA